MSQYSAVVHFCSRSQRFAVDNKGSPRSGPAGPLVIYFLQFEMKNDFIDLVVLFVEKSNVTTQLNWSEIRYEEVMNTKYVPETSSFHLVSHLFHCDVLHLRNVRKSKKWDNMPRSPQFFGQPVQWSSGLSGCLLLVAQCDLGSWSSTTATVSKCKCHLFLAFVSFLVH